MWQITIIPSRRTKGEIEPRGGFADFDEIGYWSEIKLEIVRDYASPYSRILNCKNLPHVYIDAFAGAGQHISKNSGEFVPGSPLNALNVRPPFREYHCIDLNAEKVEFLRGLTGNRTDVSIYEGDCNEVLLRGSSKTNLSHS